ncbi:hypothetical protein [Sulfuracidifex tepidarius]|uniref:Uncharacterized protein n=1 Tax=Sulfuracidifex tepidarius TaxID=1294262 RepID=A0A510E540_9CREN|nr:hypothetical protein [Sulfuracidifex tepidarius]BBG24768.1 hypothetical protein IC006_2102 [Sulfuracidifex tepidarius]BBG27557.1 hypothetical protein IC007_2111 [Sulfuracidifex tepidarius]
MLEYVPDVEDCVQEMLGLLGVEKKTEINLDFVDSVEKYVDHFLKLNSKVIAIVVHSTRKEIAEIIKKELKRINPKSEIYEFYSIKVDPKKMIILYS